MKKSLLFVSMIAALLLSGCNNVQPANSDASNADQSSLPQDESSIPISYEAKEEVINDNFTLLKPNNLSSMSYNCKKYVDDMRAQQKKLIQEKGADADYYINDLYGTSGVDITKGVLPSTRDYQDNTGGYRDGTTENVYLDAIGADYTKGQKSDESKGIEIEFRPVDVLKNKEYTISYSVNEDFSSAKTITSNLTKVYLKNLLVNQKYYVKVTADGKDSETMDFVTGDYPRWIDARPMFNVRDMGGYMTSSGQRIKQGLVYRGGEINKKTGWYGSQQYTDDLGNTNTKDGHIVSETDASKKAFTPRSRSACRSSSPVFRSASRLRAACSLRKAAT